MLAAAAADTAVELPGASQQTNQPQPNPSAAHSRSAQPTPAGTVAAQGQASWMEFCVKQLHELRGSITREVSTVVQRADSGHACSIM